MTTEIKEIGISIGVNQGTYIDTEFADGFLQLQKQNGSEVNYKKTGYWESEVIDIVGQFRDYDKIAVTKIQFTNDLYKVETRTSPDGILFEDYVALSVGGTILSTKNRYIQVKITLYAGVVESITTLDDFNTLKSLDRWSPSDMLVSDGQLRLKIDHSYSMSNDQTWTETGSLVRTVFPNSKFKQINTINIL